MLTEAVSPRFKALDTWPTPDVVSALVEAQIAAAAALISVRDRLGAAAEEAAARLRGPSGRIVYVGAGASGRLAMQDGVELAPTFGWPDDRLVLLMAGGEAALIRSAEGAEDDADEAEARIAALGLGPADVAIVVAASGRTPFAVAAARAARARGALVIGLAGNPGAPLLEAADHPILLATGPEVVAGSTRMAAGTAQKAAMNVLSTAIMVRLGRVYDNLMVDLAAANAKLEGRRLEILRRVAPSGEDEAREALDRAGGRVKLAALMLRGLGEEAARALLDRTGGDLRTAFEEAPTMTNKN